MDGSRIQRITKEGLFYLDDEDREKFISFSLCHLNYVMEIVEEGQLYRHEEKQDRIRRAREWKCVADRWAPSHFEFYTDPPLLFEFDTEELFRAVQYAMAEHEWYTFDRT